MDRFLNKLERKFGKYAVPHLAAVMIGCYVVGYILELINPDVAAYMMLEPAEILRGQLWRLITWVLIPPGSLSIWTAIMLFFYLSIGTSLERVWGNFRYNVYIFSGMLITVIAAFITYFIFSGIYGVPVPVGRSISTYYICMSIFLAYAATFPDAQVLLYFVIPIRVKWLGILYGAFLVYDCIGYLRAVAGGNLYALVYIIMLAASLLNFVIFFFTMRKSGRVRLTRAQKEMRRQFRQAAQAAAARQEAKTMGPGNDARHRCEICGRTELTNPELDFRYCTKCHGDHEYCSDHLFTHMHIQPPQGTAENSRQ